MGLHTHSRFARLAEISQKLAECVKRAQNDAQRGARCARARDAPPAAHATHACARKAHAKRPYPTAPPCAGKKLLDDLKRKGEELLRTNPNSDRLQPYKSQYMRLCKLYVDAMKEHQKSKVRGLWWWCF